MALNFYNVSLKSQASNIRYFPYRDGPISDGWNLTYTGNQNNFTNGNNAVGNDSRRTSLVGAGFEMDWIGTAAYLFGKAEAGTYAISIDGGEAQSGQPDGATGLLGKFEGLSNGNHTVRLDVTNTTDGSEVEFREALLTIQLGDEG